MILANEEDEALVAVHIARDALKTSTSPQPDVIFFFSPQPPAIFFFSAFQFCEFQTLDVKPSNSITGFTRRYLSDLHDTLRRTDDVIFFCCRGSNWFCAFSVLLTGLLLSFLQFSTRLASYMWKKFSVECIFFSWILSLFEIIEKFSCYLYYHITLNSVLNMYIFCSLSCSILFTYFGLKCKYRYSFLLLCSLLSIFDNK